VFISFLTFIPLEILFDYFSVSIFEVEFWFGCEILGADTYEVLYVPA
jgi:hypothetical protein